MSASLLVLLGLGMLVAGGELFMRGAVRIAERLGVSPLMIGLTADSAPPGAARALDGVRCGPGLLMPSEQ